MLPSSGYRIASGVECYGPLKWKNYTRKGREYLPVETSDLPIRLQSKFSVFSVRLQENA